MNKIYISNPFISNNRIDYSYTVEGEWSNAFILDEKFYIEYNIDVSTVPASIAVVPLMCNILPMAWVYDADVYLEDCDKSFYESIENIKKGYEEMFPMMSFSARIHAKNIVENKNLSNNGVAAFFSGGADAFNTLVMHADEKPTLLTVWGADVTFEDTDGWNNVLEHLKDTAKQFDVDYVTIKSCLRRCFDQGILHAKVKASKDSWWHGFQHGIGLIGHAAPIAYVMGKETIYFASSFTAADKGKVTCASDPTIDNMLKFANSNIIHDGYEFARQMKIHNITKFSHERNKEVSLRVCWKSTGGSNCCECEKCMRTMLGVYAEHFEPRKFGFTCTDEKFKENAQKMKTTLNPMIGELRYGPIQDAMHKNWKYDEVLPELKWFYSINRSKIGYHPVQAFIENLKQYKYKMEKKFRRK